MNKCPLGHFSSLMKKLICFDWDDTLYDSKAQKLPESNLQLLQELQKREDIVLCIASGRAAFYFKNFGIDWDAYVTNNGQYVKVNQEVIFENKVDPKMRQELMEWLKERGGTLFGVHSELGICKTIDPSVDIKSHDSYQRISVYGPHQDHLPYEHILLIAYDPQYDQELKAKYPEYIIHRYNGYMVDVIPQGITKLHSIEKVADYLNIKLKDVIAFGDSDNDLEMIEGVGIGIAMGNANANVKFKAKMITDDFNQEGIRHALEKLHIL